MSTIRHTYLLRFEMASHADANIYARELREMFLDASTDISVQLKREDQRTQDFGSTLVLILGAPAIIAAVNVIGNWLQRHPNASITIEKPDGKITVQNITSKEATKLAMLNLSDHQEKDKGHE